MTSAAMIAGMVPMALGLGEGGEQTAPLGRAVIGGLVASTLTTLLVLPCIFALIQGKVGRESASLDPDDPQSPHFVRVPAPHLTNADTGGPSPVAPVAPDPGESPGHDGSHARS
jgi:hypothetical protein